MLKLICKHETPTRATRGRKHSEVRMKNIEKIQLDDLIVTTCGIVRKLNDENQRLCDENQKLVDDNQELKDKIRKLSDKRRPIHSAVRCHSGSDRISCDSELMLCGHDWIPSKVTVDDFKVVINSHSIDDVRPTITRRRSNSIHSFVSDWSAYAGMIFDTKVVHPTVKKILKMKRNASIGVEFLIENDEGDPTNLFLMMDVDVIKHQLTNRNYPSYVISFEMLEEMDKQQKCRFIPFVPTHDSDVISIWEWKFYSKGASTFVHEHFLKPINGGIVAPLRETPTRKLSSNERYFSDGLSRGGDNSSNRDGDGLSCEEVGMIHHHLDDEASAKPNR